MFAQLMILGRACGGGWDSFLFPREFNKYYGAIPLRRYGDKIDAESSLRMQRYLIPVQNMHMHLNQMKVSNLLFNQLFSLYQRSAEVSQPPPPVPFGTQLSIG